MVVVVVVVVVEVAVVVVVVEVVVALVVVVVVVVAVIVVVGAHARLPTTSPEHCSRAHPFCAVFAALPCCRSPIPTTDVEHCCCLRGGGVGGMMTYFLRAHPCYLAFSIFVMSWSDPNDDDDDDGF